MVDVSLGGTINTSADVGLSVSSSSESSTFPITVAKPHFENEMKTNYKLVDVGKAESLTDTKEGETLKMVCTNGNITKTGTVNKVDVSGRDSVSNIRKRALATELNDLCKTAKVTEETGAFDLSVSHGSMHEGKLDIDLEATKKYKEQYVSSVLHNNPFGCIHTLCNSNTKISDDIGKYCHQKNIETCNACNMHNLQMHRGSDLNANSSQESILQKRVHTEAQIAEIIKGISLLKLCSKLKKIHQVNRNVSKISASECFPAFAIDTHCTANMGIVFPSTSKYRNKITCHSGFNANVRACSIDEHDMSPSFSERKNNEKVIGTLKPFTCEIGVRAENEVEEKESHEAENTPQEINISDERNALIKKCFVNKNENSRASNVFVNKNLPRECVIKCEFNTDCYSEQNQERNINSGKELNKCSAKEVIIARSEKMIHISEPSWEKCSEVVQCTLSAHEYMTHESSTCEMAQQKFKKDLRLNSTHGIFYSEIRNSGAVKGDCDDNISEHFVKPDAKNRVLQIKDNTSVISKWGFERVSRKQESMSKEDEVMPFVTSRIDVKICDISRLQISDSDGTKNNISDSCVLRNDTMNTRDICKSNLLKKSKELFGSSPIKHVCATPNEKHLCTSDKVHENNDDPMSTLEIMEINYDMNKNDEDKMSNTHIIKNLEANDLVYKSDIDNIFHIGSRVNGMDATDVVYKSDEDDEMPVGSSVKDMDTNDSVYKSDDDGVMHIGSTAKNMDTTDAVYKSDEDDVMHIRSTAKNMDTTDVVYKNDEDDMMHIGSSVKDMDANDPVYKSEEDDVMHIKSTAKNMDTTDAVYKSDEDDVMHIGSNVKDMDTTDAVYKSDEDDVMHIGSNVKDMDTTDAVYKSDEDDVMHIGSTAKDMDTTDTVYKSDEGDVMHIGSNVKDMDATDQVYKSDEDDVMHIGSTAKDMDTTDAVYKSDEDELMHIGSTAKNMDATDQVYKSEEDDVMHIGSNVKDMDATDLVYKSDEDDVMHIGSTAKNMDTTDAVYKSDEDDVMHIGSTAKDMDTTDTVYKSDEGDVMHIGSNVKDMDATDQVYKSDEDDVMHIGSTAKDMDTTDAVYKSDEDELMHIGSTAKNMDATDQVYKSEENDVMHIGSNVKDMDATDLVYKSDEDDVMHIRSTAMDMDPTVKDMNATDVSKSGDDVMHIASIVKDMEVTDLEYKSDDNDDGMSVVSSIKYMDIDIKNKRSEGNIGDTSKIKAMHRSKDCRKGQIDISDVDNLVSTVNDCVSIKDAFNPGFNKQVCDNLSMAVEANESNMISGDVKDVIDSDSWDQEHEMLSVMSADTFEDDCSLCSMKEVMSEGSGVELTDIHCYRHVDVCSDSDTDTLRDGSESNDDHTASYEETSDATSLNETITSDYIEKDVIDSSRCGDYDEIEEEEEENDNDGDDFDCDYVSCSKYDTSSCERDRDVMSCSSGQETSDEVMSLTGNGDDEMNELSTH